MSDETVIDCVTDSKRKRKKISLEDHIEHYDALIEALDAEIDRKKRNSEHGIRFIRKTRKNVICMRSEAIRLSRAKRHIRRNPDQISGLDYPCKLSNNLSKFIGVSEDTTLTRKEITNAVYAYINIKEGETREHILRWEYLNPVDSRRCLQDPKDKRRILPDAPLSKLLGYEKYKKDIAASKITAINKKTGESYIVTDDKLDYNTIQVLIQKHCTTIPLNKN